MRAATAPAGRAPRRGLTADCPVPAGPARRAPGALAGSR